MKKNLLPRQSSERHEARHMAQKPRRQRRTATLLLKQVLVVVLSLAIALEGSVTEAAAQAFRDAATAETIEQILNNRAGTAYGILYDANATDATGTMDGLVFGSDDEEDPDAYKVTVPDCAYTREGYTFTGWNTTPDGNDVIATDDDGNPYVKTAAQEVPAGTELDRFRFAYDIDGNGYIGESEIVDLYDCLDGNYLTLYAQWEEASEDEEGRGNSDAPVTSDAAVTELAALSLDDTIVDASALNTANTVLVEADEVSEEAFQLLMATAASDTETATQDNHAADGQSIDSVVVKWLTADTVDDSDASRLSIVTTSDSNLSVRIRIDLALSGEDPYDIGTVSITIPKQIFRKRDGTLTGSMSLAVPAAPDNYALFAYTEMADSYVLTNTRKLSASSAIMIELTISGIKPSLLNGNLGDPMSVSNPFKAYVEAVTEAGSVISRTSGELTATVDTSKQVTSATTNVQAIYPSWPSSWSGLLEQPEKPDDYIYVEYYAYCYTRGNQAYNLTVTHTANDANAIVLGVAKGSTGTSRNIAAGDGTSSLTVSLGTTTYTRCYVAYPKSSADEGGLFTLGDTATFVLVSTDDQEETDASDAVTTSYRITSFTAPTSYYDVQKYVSNSAANAGTLNLLAEGKSVDVSYRVTSTALGAALTAVTVSGDSTVSSQDDLGQAEYTVSTTDNQVRLLSSSMTNLFGENVNLSSSDYALVSVAVGSPTVYEYEVADKDTRGYVQSGNSLTTGTIASGSWGYVQDNTATVDVEIYALDDNGAETPVATVAWEGYDYTLTYHVAAATHAVDEVETGSSQLAEPEVEMPDGAVGYRTAVTTKHAGVKWQTTPTVRLLGTGAVAVKAQALLDASKDDDTGALATAYLRNYTAMTVTDAANNEAANDTHWADAELTAVGQAVGLASTVTYENDLDNQLVKLHYSATVRDQSNITNLERYQQLKEDGVLTTETTATWYDLLPRDVIPDLSSVKASSPTDTVTNVRTVSNYQGTGRTLLVVTYTHVPTETYSQSATNTSYGLKGYYDTGTIEFDAVYTWMSLNSYGPLLDNVVAYQSANSQFGTIKNYRGEPDNPSEGNNMASASVVKAALTTETLLAAMTGLSGESDPGNSFVYASASSDLSDINRWALSSIDKKVAVNNEGLYAYGSTDMDLNVYVGGPYTYRLSYSNEASTSSEYIVLFDELEALVPEGATEAAWRGKSTITGIDVSPMVAKGVSPAVYYATQPLDLSVEANRNFTDTSLWSEWSDDLGEETRQSITVIAIDASKDTDGNTYVLGGGETLMAYVTMRAPDLEDLFTEEELAVLTSESVDLTSLGYVYNDVFYSAEQILSADGSASETYAQYAETYTQVGLAPFSVTAEVSWSDGTDRDVLRPSAMILQLLANGEVKDTQVVGAENTSVDFGLWPRFDTSGQIITYTVQEVVLQTDAEKAAFIASLDDVELANSLGDYVPYETLIAASGADAKTFTGTFSDYYTVGTSNTVTAEGLTVAVTNTHDPLRVVVTGVKVWVGDGSYEDGKDSTRPTSIQVSLDKNGSRYQTTKVSGGTSTDTWAWSFDNLLKYENVNGQRTAIAWSAQESAYIPGYVTTVASSADSAGNVSCTITNTWDPYGDIVLSKSIENATPVSENAEFTFEFSLVDATGEEVLNVYTWDSDTGRSGTVASGGTFTIYGDETVTIHDVDSECIYTLMEESLPGWAVTKSSGLQGMIRAGERCEASVTNRYSAEGTVSLVTETTLVGTEIARRAFSFQVLEADDEGGLTSSVLLTASNNEAGTTTEDLRPSGDVTSRVTTTFPVIRYTLSDLEEGEVSKEFTYYVRQVDGGASGYIYDNALWRVNVLVEDAGDGTLTVTPTYTRVDDATTENHEAATFANVYEAEGSVTIRAWKTLVGRDLRDGEFTFQVALRTDDGDAPVILGADGHLRMDLTYDEASGTFFNAAGEVVEADYLTATNAADGTIEFTSVVFDQTNVGGVYDFVLSEVAGQDETIKTYDDSTYVYEVKVLDTGTGALMFDAEYLDGDPVFKNVCVDGALQIVKAVKGDNPTPGYEFKFLVTLTSEDGEAFSTQEELEELIKSLTRTRQKVSTTETAPAAAEETSSGQSASAGMTQTSVAIATEDVAPAAATAGDVATDAYVMQAISTDTSTAVMTQVDVYSGECGDRVTWSFDSSTGALSIAGTGGGTGALATYSAPESVPWNDYRSQIKSVTWSGTLSAESLGYYFKECTNLESVGPLDDTSSLDTSGVTDLSYVFYGCSSLTSLAGLASWNTSNVKKMTATFYNCSSLETLEGLEEWDTSNVVAMNYTFAHAPFGSGGIGDGGDYSLRPYDGIAALDLFGMDVDGTALEFDPDETSTLESSLENATAIKNWNTEKVKNMTGLFSECTALGVVDLTNWSTKSMGDEYLYPGNFTNIFNNCTALAQITFGSDWTLFGTDSSDQLPDLEPDLDLETPEKCWVCIETAADHLGLGVTSSAMAARCNGGSSIEGTWVVMANEFSVSYRTSLGSGSASGTGYHTELYKTLSDASLFYRFGYKLAGWTTAEEDETLVSDSAQSGATVAASSLLAAAAVNDVDDADDDSNDAAASTGTSDSYYALGDSLYTPLEGLTLHAVWAENPVTVEPTEGGFYVYVAAGEAVLIEGLPAGVSYTVQEQTPEGWILLSESGTHGTIEPRVAAEDEDKTNASATTGASVASFVNEYDPDAVQVSLSGIKYFTSGSEKTTAGGYTFQLTSTDAINESQTVTSAAADGSITFSPLTYRYEDLSGTGPWTFTYEVSEVADSNDEDIVYDPTTYTVEVTVTAGTSSLEASVTINGDAQGNGADFTFTNRSTAEDYGALSLTNTVVGYTGDTNDLVFTYTVTIGDTVQTVSLGANETWVSTEADAGTAYTVTPNTAPSGFATSITNGSGAIVGGAITEVEAVNTYRTTWVDIEATKVLEGREITEGEFAFQLVEVEVAEDGTISKKSGGVTATGTNTLVATASGDALATKVVMEPVEIKDPGVTYLLLTETEGDDPTVTYSSSQLLYRVTTVDSNGELEASVEYGSLSDSGQFEASSDAPAFTNTVTPGDLVITKRLEGVDGLSGDLLKLAQEAQFAFEVTFLDASGNVLDGQYECSGTSGTVKSGDTILLTAGQSAAISGLPVGTQYQVEEVLSEDLALSFALKSVTNSSGTISGADVYAEFVNEYVGVPSAGTIDYTPQVGVAYAAHTIEAGEFMFRLATVEDGALGSTSTASNDADGIVTFDTFTYSAKDVGQTFTYQVVQVPGDVESLYYDARTVTLEVTVRDAGGGTLYLETVYSGGRSDVVENATFVNWNKIVVPFTGAPGIWLATAAALGLMVLCAWAIRRRAAKET